MYSSFQPLDYDSYFLISSCSEKRENGSRESRERKTEKGMVLKGASCYCCSLF